MIGPLFAKYLRLGNWLLPLMRSKPELARLPYRYGAAWVDFEYEPGRHLLYAGCRRRETAAQRLLRLVFSLDPLGATITLPAGDRSAGDDTTVNSAAPTNNYGATNTMSTTKFFVGSWQYSKPLLRFDLTGIPAGATLNSATLSLYATTGAVMTHALTTSRVLAANDWIEAEATWNIRKTATAWTGSAGCSTSGTDYSATPLWADNVAYTTGGQEVAMTLNLTEFASMITANQGVIVTTATNNSSGITFASSDHATAGYRPKLVIDYNAGGARAFCVIAG